MLAKLALEDGTVFTGKAFGAKVVSQGEVVFNTSMTGYQEILTDPSYKGQIVAMTYPQIGNYGINQDDAESDKPQVEGFIVRELSQLSSNFRATGDLNHYLEKAGIPGIEGIDTRALVRRLRIRGAMRGTLACGECDDQKLIRQALDSPSMEGLDLAKAVMPVKMYAWDLGFTNELVHYIPEKKPTHHVVALDFGMKQNILRCLVRIGCKVTVMPGNASASEILAQNPDGIFISNGPGDPAAVTYGIQTLKELIEKKPIFGICLGHQLLGLACGASTFKLKFGHRGANHPVLNIKTKKVEITTQNHGFAVATQDLPTDLEPTHVNLNDNTLEGMRHRKKPVISVQYHPESSAGPHDSGYLFEQFRDMMG
ncbi:MAG: carbamoyl-phosphate synthase small subunit [Gemmataceae bacterium]|nr:carbamoyl-phosphate synthase small subunit [Gemmataceae bacterium]